MHRATYSCDCSGNNIITCRLMTPEEAIDTANKAAISRANYLLLEMLIIPKPLQKLGMDNLAHANGALYSFGVLCEDKRTRTKYRVFYYHDCKQLGIVKVDNYWLSDEDKKYSGVLFTRDIDEINKRLNDICKQTTF